MSRMAERGQDCLEAQRRRVCALADEAEVHRNQADYRKAESLLRQSLAVVHKYQGRFAEGGRLYRRALRITLFPFGLEDAGFHTANVAPTRVEIRVLVP